MPRWIGMQVDPHYNPGATKALRQYPYKGTIPCVICGRPAADQFKGSYYCKFHLRCTRGF